MAADSYCGETVVGRCENGHLAEIAADRELFGPDGYCPDCEKITGWSVLFSDGVSLAQ